MFYLYFCLHYGCIYRLLAVGRATINNLEIRRATLMYLSLGQAAKETGMDKSTISRAIKSGKLSATRKENGGYEIDPAELFRVFAPASKETEPSALAHDTTRDVWSENQAIRLQLEAATLRTQLEAATLRIQDKDEEIRDLRHRLDTEGEERRKLTLMLLASHHTEPPQAQEHQQGEAAPLQRPPHPTVQPGAIVSATPKKSGFWRWRWRRG
jgi:hypothetical protein